jgi:hypothetical protein
MLTMFCYTQSISRRLHFADAIPGLELLLLLQLLLKGVGGVGRQPGVEE